jgi:two-component system, NarL family, nitrate/nitrite response regulator NarL
VDEDERARQRLGAGLRGSGDFAFVFEASLEEAVEAAAALVPEVVLLDLRQRGSQLRATLRSVLAQVPGARIVVMTGDARHEIAFQALQAGAAGVLLRGVEIGALARTLAGVAAGEAAVSRRCATWLARRAREEPRRRAGMRPVTSTLTSREWEVLDLLATGSSEGAIARRLGVTVGTVRSHVRALRRKGLAEA